MHLPEFIEGLLASCSPRELNRYMYLHENTSVFVVLHVREDQPSFSFALERGRKKGTNVGDDLFQGC